MIERVKRWASIRLLYAGSMLAPPIVKNLVIGVVTEVVPHINDKIDSGVRSGSVNIEWTAEPVEEESEDE